MNLKYKENKEISLKISKNDFMEISNDLDQIVSVIDKIDSGFDNTENMALALVLFFKEKKVLDKLSRARRVISDKLSTMMSDSEYDEWIEQETDYWKPPYTENKDELLRKIQIK